MTFRTAVNKLTTYPTKAPLTRKWRGGHNTQFPMERRYALNLQWSDYTSFTQGDFRGFSEYEGEPNRLQANVFRYVRNFYASTVVPKEIKITAGGRAQSFVDAIHDNLLMAMREVVSDMVTYGVGVFDNRLPLQPRAVNPMFWFPTCVPYDHTVRLFDQVIYPYMQKSDDDYDRLRIIDIDYDKNRFNARSTKYSGITVGQGVGEREEGYAPNNCYIQCFLGRFPIWIFDVR